MPEVKLKSPFAGSKSTAWARIQPGGGIELELYDFSDEAQSSMGNDVAWIWTVGPAARPRFVELLAARAGTAIPDDKTLLDALARLFEHVHAIREWMKENQIPYEEKFDSWA